MTSNQREVAIVTGGSSGIGRATAVALAKEEGANVVIAARREKEGQKTVQLVKEAGGDGIFVRTDVTSEDDVRALVEKTVKEYGGLDHAEGLSESIQYELEPFGIKIIIVEPGGVGSNFLKNLKWASKTSDPSKSPYRSIQTSISEYFKKWAQNLTHPSEVAKVILKAVTSDKIYTNHG